MSPGTPMFPEEGEQSELQGLYHDLLSSFQTDAERPKKPMTGFSQILAMITEVINDQNEQLIPLQTAVSIDASNCDTPPVTKGSHSYLYSDIEEASMSTSTHHGIVSEIDDDDDDDDDNRVEDEESQFQEDDTEVEEVEDEVEVFQDCEHQHDSVIGFEERLLGLVSHLPRPEDLNIPPPIPQVVATDICKDNAIDDTKNNNNASASVTPAEDGDNVESHHTEREAMIRHATSSLFEMPITRPFYPNSVAEQDLFRHFSTPKVVMPMTELRETLDGLSLGTFQPSGDSGGGSNSKTDASSSKSGEARAVSWADQQQQRPRTSSTVLMDKDSSSLAIGGNLLSNLLNSFKLSMPHIGRRNNNNDNPDEHPELSGGDPQAHQ